ncbi:MAG: glycoside hydrolase family 3 C-terminal domain-containing protein [Myxococcales bacterium]
MPLNPTANLVPFRNPELTVDERARDLVARLTPDEKAAQLLHDAPAIERLGIPPYNYWNEGLHGVARAGIATVFPQAIALAATWNVPLMSRIAVAISDEARAKHHEYARQGDFGIFKGLTYWSPNINIFRDPRWGRGHETYGECPYLTGRLGVAFVKGLQGDDPRYLKLVATPKHLAVHSGPEALRHSFDARVSAKDLRETYLAAFFDCIVEGGAHSVMAGYNRVNGEPCCASDTLLHQFLRQECGFQGFVVSDCWAIRDFHEHHHVTTTPEESAALALRAGCDLNCGCTYEHLPGALAQGLIREADLDLALERVFRARLLLGMFDPPERVPYSSIPYEVNDCAEHRALARKAAQESLVLLKNSGALPLAKDIGTVAVIGPNAADTRVLLGNYHGMPSRSVTPLDGIRAAVSAQTRVLYAEGCKLQGLTDSGLGSAGNLSEARSVASRADVVIVCLGLNADIEGEQGDAAASEAAGDKLDLNLTGLQARLLAEMIAIGKPTIVVVLAGSALDLTFAEQHASAILMAWYPGEEGGSAIADALFGDYCPAGRLPITFPKSAEQLPPFESYAMAGRTYRYLEHEPLYPFGYGLSYARFGYDHLRLSQARIEAGQAVAVSVSVTNLGAVAADEVVQIYVSDVQASCVVPHRSLRGFARVRLAPGESRSVSFTLSARDLSLIDLDGQRRLEPGIFRLSVGGSQPDSCSARLLGQAPLSVELEVWGEPLALPY